MAVFDQLLALINRSSVEVVFCLEEEMEDVKDVLELMFEKRTNHTRITLIKRSFSFAS